MVLDRYVYLLNIYYIYLIIINFRNTEPLCYCAFAVDRCHINIFYSLGRYKITQRVYIV